MHTASFCEVLERRTLLSTITNGVYSLTMQEPDTALSSDLDSINHQIKFGDVNVYDVFSPTTASPSLSRNLLIEAGMHRLLQFDLVSTRVYSPPQTDFAGTSGDDTMLVRASTLLGVYQGSYLTVTINGTEHSTSTTELRIDGGGGNDTITIDLVEADDADVKITLNGGEGNDTITGGVGTERIFAGAGDDSVNGLGGKDTIYGEAGNDFLRGGGSSDLLDGGEGYDTIFGDAGNDNVSGGANPDRLRGGDGNDTLRGNGGRDILAGGAGDDELFGLAGADVFNGGEGADRFVDLAIDEGDQGDLDRDDLV